MVQAHMVLAYHAQPHAEPVILDNLISELRPASRRPDLTPVFSFNGDGLWQGVGDTTAGDPLARAVGQGQGRGFPVMMSKARGVLCSRSRHCVADFRRKFSCR